MSIVQVWLASQKCARVFKAGCCTASSVRVLEDCIIITLLGLASISIWLRSDRRSYAAITCDQVLAWSRSLIADSQSAESAQVSVICCTNLDSPGNGGHLATVINCTVLHGAWRGGWEMSQRQQPVKRCTAVGSCREDELKRIILPDWLQWRPATRDVGGGIMVACGVALDIQLLVTRRR